VFEDPETVALKDCVAPARTVAVAGETLTVTLDPEEELELEDDDPLTVPVQPASATAAIRNTKNSGCRIQHLIGFSMGKVIEKEASERRIPSPQQCRSRRIETTVRKAKLRPRTPEQDMSSSVFSVPSVAKIFLYAAPRYSTNRRSWAVSV